MSLLMKALEQAEENRRILAGERAPAQPCSGYEPSREPAGGAESAANLLRAEHGGKRSSGSRVTSRIVAAASLLLCGWGFYVYLAVNHPAPLRSSSPGDAVAVSPSPAHVPIPPRSAMAPAIADDFALPPKQLDRLPRTSPAAPAVVREQVPPAEPPAADKAVRILRHQKTPADTDFEQAYRALRAGRLDEARTHYLALLQQDPRNQDAIVGMAVVAGRNERLDEAAEYYLRALETAPDNALAQAGLLSVLGTGDPAAGEAHLKQLLAHQPTAFLYFALGNLLASHARWNEAQQAYFQAYHLAAEDPDHAFNLAVSLEHLDQPKSALAYYRRAMDLAQTRGAGFDRAAAEARVRILSGAAQ